MVLPSLVDVSSRPSMFSALPSSTTNGRLPLLAKSGSLLASMTTASEMGGKALTRLITWPPSGEPGMLKSIRSASPTLAVLLAARMASRSEITPSAPRLLFNANNELTSPSFVSLVVLTVIALSVPKLAALIEMAPTSHCCELPAVLLITTDAAPASVLPRAFSVALLWVQVWVWPPPCAPPAGLFCQYCTSITSSPTALLTVKEAVVPVPLACVNAPLGVVWLTPS